MFIPQRFRGAIECEAQTGTGAVSLAQKTHTMLGQQYQFPDARKTTNPAPPPTTHTAANTYMYTQTPVP